METTIQLLMRDGALRIAFHPKLTAEQYGELLAAANRATTKAELMAEVKALSKRWAVPAEIDSVLDRP